MINARWWLVVVLVDMLVPERSFSNHTLDEDKGDTNKHTNRSLDHNKRDYDYQLRSCKEKKPPTTTITTTTMKTSNEEAWRVNFLFFIACS